MEKSTQKNGWKIYKRLIRIALRNNSTPVVIAIFGMIITAVSDPALSAIMKPILDGGFIQRDPNVISLLPFGLFAIFLIRSFGIFLTIYFIEGDVCSSKVIFDFGVPISLTHLKPI